MISYVSDIKLLSVNNTTHSGKCSKICLTIPFLVRLFLAKTDSIYFGVFSAEKKKKQKQKNNKQITMNGKFFKKGL